MIERVRVWINSKHCVDLVSYIIYQDGSGIIEGENIKTGDEVAIKSWVLLEPLKEEIKPVKIVEKKNPLKRDDA